MTFAMYILDVFIDGMGLWLNRSAVANFDFILYRHWK